MQDIGRELASAEAGPVERPNPDIFPAEDVAPPPQPREYRHPFRVLLEEGIEISAVPPLPCLLHVVRSDPLRISSHIGDNLDLVRAGKLHDTPDLLMAELEEILAGDQEY
jgi:hypothetical protein